MQPDVIDITPEKAQPMAIDIAQQAVMDKPPYKLTPTDLMRLGAFTLDAERSQAVEQKVKEQRAFYQDASKAELIDALIDRDRHLMQTGREAADGRMTGRLLRELLRGLLTQADQQQLRAIGQVGGKGEAIEGILRMLGAEPADRYLLKKQGTMLGALETWECGCGALNGVNLVVCGICERTRREGEVKR